MEPMSSPTPVLAAGSAAARSPNPNHPPNLQVPKPDPAHLFDSRSHSSPITHRMDSAPLSTPAALFDAAAVRTELARNTLNTTSNFLERLLPDERLPFPVNEDLLRKLSGTNAPIWNEHKSCFRQPPMYFGEAAVCEWLNNVGAAMGLVYGRQCKRLWWCGDCRVPFVDPSIPRKPDLILLDRDYYDSVSQINSPGTKWFFVKALAEVHQTLGAKLTDTISVRPYLMFLCQQHRRFTIYLSFIYAEQLQFSITVTDRAGQVRVNKIDLMGSSIENGLLLLSLLAFLMFGSSEDIGLDPSFEINPSTGQIVAIKCENRRFEVVKRIHALSSLFGRGTQVWIVTHKGTKYVMKDSWVKEDCIRDEVAHLRRMKDHKELNDRVPTLICGGDVVINGIKDSMQRYRSAPCSHRIHRRIVTSPVGEPITSFKSKKEFIKVMISIIETHRYLHDHVGILHRDLSANNVLLNRKDNEFEATGLLIDYDYSLVVDSNHQIPCHTQATGSTANASSTHAAEDISIGERAVVMNTDIPSDTSEGNVAIGAEKAQSEIRTGTPPYMAIEALLGLNPKFVHKPEHDLESILYIILYMCTFVQGPGLLLDLPHAYLPIRSWFKNNDIRDMAYCKLAHLECYNIAILPNFTSYWHDFTPFVEKLIIACFPVRVRLPNELRYEQALRILEEAYHVVEEPLHSVKQPSSTLLHQNSKKRKCTSSYS